MTSAPNSRRARRIIAWPIACCFGFGCSLLLPYPGGGDPVDAFSAEGSGIPGGEDPLVDPATDSSVTVTSEIEVAVALPGSAFPILLDFEAPNANVIGGGIRFAGSDEVQWTFVSGVNGLTSGSIEFGYVIAEEACEGLDNLCHEIMTEQFAVTELDGEFAVSVPVDVPVVLLCATCDSASCVDLLPAGSCKSCVQPDPCVTLYEMCFAPGMPGEDQAALFDAWLGENGVLWTAVETCAQGEVLCEGLLDEGTCEL